MELKPDIKKFTRKLRLMEYSAKDDNGKDNNNNSQNIIQDSNVRNPSTFNPPAHRDLVLDTYVDYITKYPFEDILKNKQKVTPNLKKGEWEDLTKLKKDNNLIKKGK